MAAMTPAPRGVILSDDWLRWDPETIAWYPESPDPSAPVEPEPSAPQSATGRPRWLAVEAAYFVLAGFLTGIVTSLVLALAVLLVI